MTSNRSHTSHRSENLWLTGVIMRVAVIGAGGQGVGLAGLLIQEPDVTEVVVADFSADALANAEAFIDKLGDRKLTASVRYEQVNASDATKLREITADVDVIANCTVPGFNVPIMEAAIAVRAHYIDLFASPYEAEGVPYSETIDAQFDLDQDFAAAGLTAEPSIGISPGWTALAAQKAIDSLDTVDHVVIRFFDWVDTDELFLPVSPYVIMHEWLGAPYPVRIVNGEVVEADLLESAESFDFLEPLGERTVYTVTAHPDIVLIERFAGKPIGRLEEKFGIGLGNLSTTDVLFKAPQRAAVAQGSARTENNLIESLEAEFIPPFQYESLVEDGRIRAAHATYTTEVAGVKDGRRERHISYYSVTPETVEEKLPGVAGPVYATVGGTPIEIVLTLGRGEMTERGVRSIGQLENREQLLERLADRKIDIVERIIVDE